MPVITGKQLLRVLGRQGFAVIRIHSSHHVMQHPDGRVTSVPVHAGDDVKVGMLHAILNDIGLTADELRQLL